MGFLNTLLGRTKPVQPKLDDLFALPSAAITLQASSGFTPTGSGSVCFRSVEGKTFSDIESDVRDLLNMDAGKPGGGPRVRPFMSPWSRAPTTAHVGQPALIFF